MKNPLSWQTLKVTALLVISLGVPVISWELLRALPSSIVDTPKPTFAEVVTIVLAAVTIVLAVLAIGVAFLAVYGYQSIKNEAAHAAERAVEKSVADAVTKHVNEAALQRLIRKEMTGNAGPYPEAFADAPPDVEPHTKLGADYPKDEGHDAG